MAKTEIEYGQKKVTLSRLYPFGEVVEIQIGKETKKVTELTLNELNGFDDEIITNEVEKNKKIGGYVQISVSAGIEYKEALSLANKDSSKIMEVLQGF